MAKYSLNYYQALHVGQVKTDVIQFTTIQAAIDAIPDNATGKRYAVYVHPGSYAEQIVMEDYVDLIAIGGREETIITHLCTGHDQITVTGENAMIKGFTIVSDGDTNTFRTRCVSNALDGFEMVDCVLTATAPAAAAITFIATASSDIRDCDIDIAATAATAVSLDTNTENYNIDDSRLGGATTSLLVTTCLTLNVTRSTLYNLLDHDACATSTIIRDCILEAIDFDGGTAFNLHETYVETIAANTGGTVIAYGGTIRACTSVATATFVWWRNDNELQLIANMLIANALAAAAAGDLILIRPGTYAESNLTLVASVNLIGTDLDQCIISTGDAANPIINSGVTCTMSNLTVTNTNAGAPALTVTANTLTARDCAFNGTGVGDAVAMTAGTLVAYDTVVGTGDIDLSTGACTLNMYRCRITAGPIDTAGALAHTLILQQCNLGGQAIASAATGGTTLTVDGCSRLGAVTNAGTGAFTIYESYVASVNQTNGTGTTTLYGGYLGTVTRGLGATVWWKHDNELWVLPSGTTTDPMLASALAAAGAGDVIKVTPGTYAESNVTLIAGVDIVGTDPRQCIISTGDAGNPIVNNGVTCALANLTIINTNAGAAGLAVTANTLTLRNCVVSGTGAGDAIAMTGGTLSTYDTEVGTGDVDLSTGVCTLNMYRCRITAGPVDTAGALAHAMTFENCDFGGQNLASAATGATTLAMDGCSRVGQVANAGGGAFTIRGSEVNDVTTTSTGDITITGGSVQQCTAASAGGAIVWWQDSNLIHVISGMLLNHALGVAGAGDTIKLGQGAFAESNLTAVNGVDIIGEGQDQSVIEATDNANPIITVGDGVTCVFQWVKISNLGTAAAVAISAGAGAAALTARDCLIKSDAANSIVTVTTTGVGAPTFVADLTTFDTGADAVTVTGAVAATIIVRACVFLTCTLAFSTTGANHVFRIDGCDFSADNATFAGITLSANAPVVTLSDCSGIGLVTHSTASTVTISNCRFSNTYTIGAVAGVVNATRTEFTTFTNGGSGAISFEACFGTTINNNSTSTMTIEGGHWDTVLQAAAAGTINIYGAVVATELDCSAAGAINAYNCEITTIDANGGTVTVYGGDLRDVADVTGDVVWWISRNTLKVFSGSANMVISQALTAAGAGNVILIGPGTYAESNLTLVASVNLVGTDPDQCVISTGDAGNAILNSAVACTLVNLTIANTNAGAPAIAITANALTVRSCIINGTGAGDSITMVAGTLNAYDTTIGAGDINLSTGMCTLSMYRCRITTDPIDTAGNFAHVLTFEKSDFGGQNLVSAATGATTLSMTGCSEVGTVSNAGSGAFTIWDSDISAVNATASGTFVIYGGFLNAITRAAASVVWWLDNNTLKVIPSATVTDNMIGHAITAAAAGDVILIHPGTYSQALTCKASVDLKGVGPRGSVLISITDGGPLVTIDNNVTLENLVFEITTPAGGRTWVHANDKSGINIVDCEWRCTTPGALAHTMLLLYSSTVTVERCYWNIAGTGAIRGIQTRIGACTMHLINNDFNYANVNAAFITCDVASTWTGGGNRWAGTGRMFSVSLGTFTFDNDAMVCTTGSTPTGGTMNFNSCHLIGALNNSGTGTFTFRECYLASVTQGNAAGSMVILGGSLLACGGSTGSVTWKTSAQQYEVIANMSIQHAITAAAADTPAPAAAAPYTVLIHPDVYSEVVTCSAYVHLRGMVKDGVTIQQTNADVLTLASNIEIENLTVRVTTPAAQRSLIKDGGSAYTGVKIKDVVLAYTTPAAIANLGILLTGGSTITLERVTASWAGGNAAEIILSVTTAASTVTLDGCNLSNSNTAASIINSAFAGTTITLVDTRLQGAADHLVASAGIIRIANSQYRSIARSGTGNIVDESPDLKDYAFHTMKKIWEHINAAVCNGRTAGAGAVTLGGYGQTRLRITNAAADVAAIESAADAAGALESSFTPARTPRYIQQISASAFGAGANGNRQFYGLRETLGNAVPVLGEHHAGFIWDGTNWSIQTCSDGVALETNNLASAPSTGAQHQLEIIILGGVQVEFYQDGVLVGTHTTKVPSNVLDWQELIHGAGTGAASAGDITVRRGGVQECPA